MKRINLVILLAFSLGIGSCQQEQHCCTWKLETLAFPEEDGVEYYHATCLHKWKTKLPVFIEAKHKTGDTIDQCN